MGPLAQSVEQQTFNLWVVGSIPTGPTFLSRLTSIFEIDRIVVLYNSPIEVDDISSVELRSMSDLS